MSGENKKLRKPIWFNFAVVTLLLVTTGFTITACANTKSSGESTKPTAESTKPAAESTKPADESTKPTGESTKRGKKNQPAKSAKQKDVPPDKIEETTTDDDPE